MKLNEIHDDELLIISLIHQRMDKGERVFLYDAELMFAAEEITSLKPAKGSGWMLRTNSVNGFRDIIYDDDDVEKLQMYKRSANTWNVMEPQV